jgi:hypothetical protein
LDFESTQRQDSLSANVLAQPTNWPFIAFILYRQHHQQAITARNPDLNNPDISKIIGEQWKAEGKEQKKIWQDLAQVSNDSCFSSSFLC